MKSFTDEMNLSAQSSATKIYIPQNNEVDLREAAGAGWRQIAEYYTPLKDVDEWCALPSIDECKEGYSAYEVAHTWVNAQPNLPREITALFGGSAKLLIAIPEHETPLPAKGPGSRSDVLAFVRTKDGICAVTVEGKIKEPFDKTIGAWLKNASSNKITRLQGISEHLGLADPPPDGIYYQLLHRAAAAVIEAKEFKTDCAAMVVQSFSPERKSFEDFVAFLALFGIDSVEPGRLYTTEIHNTHLHFGWVTSPKQSVATADVTAVAKTTTPPKPATPVAQSSKTQSIVIIIGLVAVLVLAGFGVVFVRRTSRTKNKVVQDGETAVAENVDADKENSDDKQGKLFESYVENLLANRKNVKLLKPANKYDYPDFEMVIRTTKHRIFLECKWKKSFYEDLYDVIDEKRLRKYKKYQKAHGHPFFIVLGVGGTEEKPDYLYAIPLEKLPETKLNYEQLMGYIQKATGYCSYNPATNTLTIR